MVPHRTALVAVLALLTAGCAGGPPQPTAWATGPEVGVPSPTPVSTAVRSLLPSANPQTILWGNCPTACIQIVIDSFTFADDWGCSNIAVPVPSGQVILRLHVTVTAFRSGEGFVGEYLQLRTRGRDEAGPSTCDAPLNTPEVWGPSPIEPGRPISGWLQFIVPATGPLTAAYGISSGESNEVVLRP